MFAADISEEETNLGYEICEIDNPHKYGLLPAPTVVAIVFRLGESDRIIKVNTPNGGIAYSHQRYGLYDWQEERGGEPNWKPVNIYFDPKSALEKAPMGIENIFPDRVKIIPKVPG